MTELSKSQRDHRDMANAITALSMDAVQRASSGHPGMPMGMADAATVLFSKFLKFDPSDPGWADRDRFILSAGHGSMLIYSLLHLTGYKAVTMDQIRNFRQLGSITAGHPEYGHVPGVETTTGPLGQGISNAVGFAIAERQLNARYGDELVDHHTYVVAGDGCLMEGISQEAISLAGHLALNKLIVMWDDNDITIDGAVSLSDSTDQKKRFEASGWKVIAVDGHDPQKVASALRRAQKSDRPTLIACKTTIGKGAPTKAGLNKAHGSPLGNDEIAGVREAIGWKHAPFEIPDSVYKLWKRPARKGRKANREWQDRLSASDVKDDFERAVAGELNEGWLDAFQTYKDAVAREQPTLATRAASGKALVPLTELLTDMVSGSADLEGSNKTKTPATSDAIQAGRYDGRYINYGIREHGMAAAMNGMALHGGIIPYSGLFMVFMDYCRPSVRLAGLMGIRSIFVATHDSIGVGEDGPTHQPVEHLASLRAIPNVYTYRPADAVETAECWELAVQRADGPSVMALTRQNVPAVRDDASTNWCERGGYVLRAGEGADDIVLIGTGSEVHLCVEAAERLGEDGISARVVSIPCYDVFMEQDADYIRSVLGQDLPKVAIEAGIRQGWDALIGRDDPFIGMQGFGASAPGAELFEHFGITANAVYRAAKHRLAR
ncbi:transketolase [uncultured Algimonas sp.]|uniref:transketolase n=1 Tax=uncultured Algimonas sp. TaxID=1547920 RepID=UPI00260A1E9B|nr:transketolase [uncultured Algimonas sp.]